MDTVLLVIVLLTTGVVVGAGIYFTFRGFRAVDHPRVEVKPRHAKDTIAQLKHFFDGKQCSCCGRSIPAVHVGEPRPGLRNVKTHEAVGWDDIPAADLSAALESHEPLCSDCVVTETFRRQHPELVVERSRPIENLLH